MTYRSYSITVKQGKGRLNGLDAELNAMLNAAMTLVPMALYTDGPVMLRNIGSWRVKETDRIQAMSTEMRKLGVKVEAGADYIAVDASVRSHDAVCFDTYNDHRMAMALALCAFDRPVTINDPECTHKTYPHFFEDFLSRCTKAQ